MKFLLYHFIESWRHSSKQLELPIFQSLIYIMWFQWRFNFLLIFFFSFRNIKTECNSDRLLMCSSDFV